MEAIAISLAVLMGIMGVFQVSLALGAPFGRAAWGGQHRVLPMGLRVGSGIAAVVFGFFITVVLSRAGIISLWGMKFSTVISWIYTVYFGIGVVMNAISRSKLERWWAPFAAAMFVLGLLLLLLE